MKHCTKCNRPVKERDSFCVSCGTRIGNHTDINGSNIKKKYSLFIFAVFIISAVIICAIVYWKFIKIAPKKPVVEGRYNSIYYEDKEYNGYYIFSPSEEDSNKGTYISNISSSSDNAWRGTWEFINEKLILTEEYTRGIRVFDIYQDYLVFNEYTYTGNIPSEATFDAVCTYEDSKYTFKSDGTYENTGDWGDDSGTYSRNGEIITLSTINKVSGKPISYRYLIYNNGINNSFYYKEQQAPEKK